MPEADAPVMPIMTHWWVLSVMCIRPGMYKFDGARHERIGRTGARDAAIIGSLPG
ncbi:hypothetical protein ETAR_21590 [Edwardsiella tarda]